MTNKNGCGMQKGNSALDSGFSGAAGVAVDGTLFVSGAAVFFLLGYRGEVGGVVFGGHGDRAVEEAGEGWMFVEDGAALGVDVEDVEGAGMFGELGLDAAEK